MAGGHQATLDAELLMQDTDGWCKAIGSAGGAGHAFHGRVVGVLVDAHDDGVGVILGGRGEDHLLGTCLQVGLDLLGGQEHARGLADVLRTVLTERNLSRVAGVRQRHLLAINDQGVTVNLHGAIILAVNCIVLHHVGQVVRIIARVDQLEVGLRILHGNAGHLAADAAEAVDADANSLEGGAALAGALACHACCSKACHGTEAGHGTNTGSLGGAITRRAEVGPLHLRLAVLDLASRRHEGTAQGAGCCEGTDAGHGNVGGGGRHNDGEEGLKESRGCYRLLEHKKSTSSERQRK